MIRYLIKNNFKLMLRNKWTLAVMVLGPIMVIAILSSAFEDLLKSYEGVDEFKTGYRVEEGSLFSDSMDVIKQAGEDAGITFLEYPEGEPKDVIENNDLAGFVVFGKEKYTVYKSADFQVEGSTLEYFFNQVINESSKQALQTMLPVFEEEEAELPVQKLDYLPAVSSNDYYGIIYIVYFSWCCVICATNILNSEKKYGIRRKFQVTAVSGWKLYLAKWIPIVLVTAVGMGITAIATALMYDIHWGNPLVASLLVLLSIIASSAFGLMIYNFCENLAITVVVVFTSVWFMGFFGGSFETYMLSNLPDAVKNASPIYHINRALVENSCMGHSTYTSSCIVYMLAITVVCSVIAVAADKLRKAR